MDLRAIYDELKTLPQEEHEYEFALANWRERAACALAYCYEHGEGGLEQNYREAFKWYKVSAQRGKRKSRYKLACMYMTGSGIRKNYRCAVNGFMELAEQGDLDAIYNIGLCYYEGGYGIGWGMSRSIEWFLKAAKMGHIPSMRKLADCYRYGLGTRASRRQSMRWRMAAAGKAV